MAEWSKAPAKIHIWAAVRGSGPASAISYCEVFHMTIKWPYLTVRYLARFFLNQENMGKTEKSGNIE